MTVVSDTSPLNYLVQVDLQRVLPALFGHVLLPDAVRQELGSPAAPHEDAARVIAQIIDTMALVNALA